MDKKTLLWIIFIVEESSAWWEEGIQMMSYQAEKLKGDICKGLFMLIMSKYVGALVISVMSQAMSVKAKSNMKCPLRSQAN